MMSHHDPIPQNELEEAAQGQDLYRAPGVEMQADKARDQAIASGWLPSDVMDNWPSVDTRRRIVDRRQDLYAAMQRLEASAARAASNGDWAAEVRDALANLDSVLQRHVDEIEGPDGLITEVIDRAPHLVPAVDTLRDEHQELIAGCQAARDVLSDGGDVSRVRRKVLSLLGRLAIHRQSGAELLYDAYNVDIAAAD
jgi:hypothetical protein